MSTVNDSETCALSETVKGDTTTVSTPSFAEGGSQKEKTPEGPHAAGDASPSPRKKELSFGERFSSFFREIGRGNSTTSSDMASVKREESSIQSPRKDGDAKKTSTGEGAAKEGDMSKEAVSPDPKPSGAHADPAKEMSSSSGTIGPVCCLVSVFGPGNNFCHRKGAYPLMQHLADIADKERNQARLRFKVSDWLTSAARQQPVKTGTQPKAATSASGTPSNNGTPRTPKKAAAAAVKERERRKSLSGDVVPPQAPVLPTTAPAAITTDAKEQPFVQETPKRTLRARVLSIYQKYSPDKVANVDTAIAMYNGDEQKLMDDLQLKYGPEPPCSPTSPTKTALPKSDYRERVIAIYEKYNPAGVAKVDTVLETYLGQEEKLIEDLVAKYGPEPATAATENVTPPSSKPAVDNVDEGTGLDAQPLAEAPAVKELKKAEEECEKKLDTSNADVENVEAVAAKPDPLVEEGSSQVLKNSLHNVTELGGLTEDDKRRKHIKSRMQDFYSRYDSLKKIDEEALSRLLDLEIPEQTLFLQLQSKYGLLPAAAAPSLNRGRSVALGSASESMVVEVGQSTVLSPLNTSKVSLEGEGGLEVGGGLWQPEWDSAIAPFVPGADFSPMVWNTWNSSAQNSPEGRFCKLNATPALGESKPRDPEISNTLVQTFFYHGAPCTIDYAKQYVAMPVLHSLTSTAASPISTPHPAGAAASSTGEDNVFGLNPGLWREEEEMSRLLGALPSMGSDACTSTFTVGYATPSQWKRRQDVRSPTAFRQTLKKAGRKWTAPAPNPSSFSSSRGAQEEEEQDPMNCCRMDSELSSSASETAFCEFNESSILERETIVEPTM